MGAARESIPNDVKPQTIERPEASTAKVETKLEALDEVELTSEDVESLEQKIPYTRFKEVNEKKKFLESEVETLKSKHQNQLENLVSQYEAKLATSKVPKEEYSIDYEDTGKEYEPMIKELQAKIDRLEQKTTHSQVNAELRDLQTEYPEADVDAVMGWYKVYPSAGLKDLMEKSHTDNITRTKTAINRMLEAKKQKAKTVVPHTFGGFKLSEGDRPKTLGEASKLMRQYADS